MSDAATAPDWLDPDALPDAGDLRRFTAIAVHGDGDPATVATGVLWPDGNVSATLADHAGPAHFDGEDTLLRMLQMALGEEHGGAVDVQIEFEDDAGGERCTVHGGDLES